MLKTTTSIALAASFLCGCTPAVVKTYTVEPASAGGVGTLRQSRDASPFTLQFVEYSEGKSLVGAKELGGHWLGYPRELKMAPGNYTVMVKCFTPNAFSFPVFHIHVSAGITYEIACARSETDVNKVRAYIKNTVES